MGQIVHAEIDAQQHPSDLKRIHRLGQLVVENLDDFAHLDAHQAIKQLQAESGVGCDLLSLPLETVRECIGMPGVALSDLAGPDARLVTVFQPRSLSPARMDATEFHTILDGLCRYLVLHYWTDINPEDALAMVDLFAFSTP